MSAELDKRIDNAQTSPSITDKLSGVGDVVAGMMPTGTVTEKATKTGEFVAGFVPGVGGRLVEGACNYLNAGTEAEEAKKAALKLFKYQMVEILASHGINKRPSEMTVNDLHTVRNDIDGLDKFLTYTDSKVSYAPIKFLKVGVGSLVGGAVGAAVGAFIPFGSIPGALGGCALGGYYAGKISFDEVKETFQDYNTLMQAQCAGLNDEATIFALMAEQLPAESVVSAEINSRLQEHFDAQERTPEEGKSYLTLALEEHAECAGKGMPEKSILSELAQDTDRYESELRSVCPDKKFAETNPEQSICASLSKLTRANVISVDQLYKKTLNIEDKIKKHSLAQAGLALRNSGVRPAQYAQPSAQTLLPSKSNPISTHIPTHHA